MRLTLRERLYGRLAPCADPACGCTCRLWTLCVSKKGYGQISVKGKPQLVHRVAWELENGPVPDGLTIDHVWDRGCRHKHCAHVAHLEPVTGGENNRRSHASHPRAARPVRTVYLLPETPEDIPAPSKAAFAAIAKLDAYLSGPVKLPPGTPQAGRRIEQSEIDAFIERNRVRPGAA